MKCCHLRLRAGQPNSRSHSLCSLTKSEPQGYRLTPVLDSGTLRLLASKASDTRMFKSERAGASFCLRIRSIARQVGQPAPTPEPPTEFQIRSTRNLQHPCPDLLPLAFLNP